MTPPQIGGTFYSADRRTARQKAETLGAIVRQLDGAPTNRALWLRLSAEAAKLATMAGQVADEIAARSRAEVEGQTTLDMES